MFGEGDTAARLFALRVQGAAGKGATGAQKGKGKGKDKDKDGAKAKGDAKKAAPPKGGDGKKAGAGAKQAKPAAPKKAGAERLDRPLVAPTCGAQGDADIFKQQFYITTAINYTNGAPHVGHAYEAVTTDIIARYHRTFGRDVFFLTGSDEHGQKVEQSAATAGTTPQQVADKYSAGFQALNKHLDITNDFYVRTTMPHHYKLAQTIWQRVRDRGDIYLKDYVGWYNVHEEQYVTDKEAEERNYKDDYGRPFEKKSEEAYFFRMSKYQEQLIKYIKEDNPLFIQPEVRKQEMLSFLSEPLQDLCISRTVCQWGIPCPPDPEYKGDKNHVMYVWFDALTNYMSGINYLRDEDAQNWSRFWPANVHIVGKDIIRFHTIIWPTMLMSAELPLPKSVFGHGFVVAADGQKMSKSVGNVVDPHNLLRLFPSDTIRYYLARTSTYGADIPFSEAGMCALHNAVLKDGLGNLLHRVTSLCSSYCDGKVPEEAPLPLESCPLPFDLANLKTIFEACFAQNPASVDVPSSYSGAGYPSINLDSIRRGNGLQLSTAAEAVAEAISTLNRYLQVAEPWKIKGKDEATMAKKRGIVRAVLEGVYAVAHFLLPFTPTSMNEVFHKIGVEPTKIHLLRNDFTNLPAGTQTYVGPILFDELAPGVGKVVPNQQNRADKAGSGKEAYAKAVAAKKAKREQAIKASQKGKVATAASEHDGPDFVRLDLRVGKIVKVWEHPDAERLFCEEIDVGEDQPRQIASGLREHYKLEEMENRLVVVVCNLKARKLAGFNSHGMVVCATAGDKSKVELLEPPAGSRVGERVHLEGRDPNEYPPDEPNRVAKKKVFEAVAPKFLTNADCVACWDSIPICTASGKCTVPTLSDSQLS